MTKIYVVSYAFKDSVEQHLSFFDELKSFEAWWHFIDGTWLVVSDLTAKEISSKLRPHITDSDNLLVLEAGTDCSGWLPVEAWLWINTQRKTIAAQAASSA